MAEKKKEKPAGRMAARMSFKTASTDAWPRGQYVAAGLVLASDDPLVKKYPDLFVAADQFQGLRVETATANPGQVRDLPPLVSDG